MEQFVRYRGMGQERLAEIVARFPSRRIAVVGDFFLDKYLDVDPRLAEISVETGKTAHQVVRIRHSPGAAGTVVCNLAALGIGTLSCVGIIGDDGEGYELQRDLAQLGCDLTHLIVTPERFTPTYLKPRDITDPSLAGEHSRYDTKNRTLTPQALVDRLLASLEHLLPAVDAVIVLDQVEEEDCGVVVSQVRGFLAEKARHYPQVIFWADSRRRIKQFRNLHLKCNRFELVGQRPATDGEMPDWLALLRAMQEFRRSNGGPVVVTLGEHGAMVSDPEITWIPAVQVPGPIDPTGAGDSLTAGAVAALASGATLPEAVLIGNLVASITVQQLATTGTAKPEELPPRLALWSAQWLAANSPF